MTERSTVVVEDPKVVYVVERGITAKETPETVHILWGVELLLPPAPPMTMSLVQRGRSVSLGTPGPQGVRGPIGALGNQGPPGPDNLFIQADMPGDPGPYLWWDGDVLWLHDGEP